MGQMGTGFNMEDNFDRQLRQGLMNRQMPQPVAGFEARLMAACAAPVPIERVARPPYWLAAGSLGAGIALGIFLTWGGLPVNAMPSSTVSASNTALYYYMYKGEI